MPWTIPMDQLISQLSWDKLDLMSQHNSSQTHRNQIARTYHLQEVEDQQIFKQMGKEANKVFNNKMGKITESIFRQCLLHQLNKTGKENAKPTIQWHRIQFLALPKVAVSQVRDKVVLEEWLNNQMVLLLVTGNSFNKVKEAALLEAEIILWAKIQTNKCIQTELNKIKRKMPIKQLILKTHRKWRCCTKNK